MSVLKGAVSVAVTLAVVSAVTAVLWYFKLATVGPEHPVFFYLLPIGVVMLLYGSRPALARRFYRRRLRRFFPLRSDLFVRHFQSGGIRRSDLFFAAGPDHRQMRQRTVPAFGKNPHREVALRPAVIAASLPGASKPRARIHTHHRFSWAPPYDFCRVCDYGFRVRRFAAPRNDGKIRTAWRADPSP